MGRRKVMKVRGQEKSKREKKKNRKKGSELKEGETSKTLTLKYTPKPLTPINR